jgi:hypothetical protein
MIRSLPIWPTLSDPLQPSAKPSLKSASCGCTLPTNFKHYRTKNDKVYLCNNDDTSQKIFSVLGVPPRDIYSYTFEDVEFPSEYDHCYYNFLSGVLGYSGIIEGFATRSSKRYFPTLTTKLKRIADLYDFNNDVFRILFNGNSDMFLRLDLLKYAGALSKIGFKSKIDQNIFVECAEKIEEMQKRLQPPTDIRYRGFVLINHFYKNIDKIDFEKIKKIRFVPVSKDLGKPYNLNYDRPQVLYSFEDVILPKYKEVSWSRMSLIAEDVIPPKKVLYKYPSLGKPNVPTVIEHLRFLCELRNNDEWRKNWAELFQHNVYEVYEWLEKECVDDEDLDLSNWISSSEPIFLNFNKNMIDPFDNNNWVSAEDLVLNSEPSEKKYVNPKLAKYLTMLKSAGAGEIKRPNFEIIVELRKELFIDQSPLIQCLLDQEFLYNDVTFIVNNEKIKASRYFLAAIYDVFRQTFDSEGPGPINININDVKPNSVRVLLRYLYGQGIDDAIKSLSDNGNTDDRYKDLLKLADKYKLVHLKMTMELRLSRFVNRLTVDDMKSFAETSNANQLKKFCDCFIQDNR